MPSDKLSERQKYRQVSNVILQIMLFSEDLTGATALSNDKASRTMAKQSHQFFYKDLTLQITRFVNSPLWM